MAELLDAYQIEAAVQFVDEHWTEVDRPMLPAERAEWTDTLAYVREGELKPVIERWCTSTRPSAAAVLDYILTNRTRLATPPPEPIEPGPRPGRFTEVVVDSIAEARETLRRRLDDRMVSCSPGPQ